MDVIRTTTIIILRIGKTKFVVKEKSNHEVGKGARQIVLSRLKNFINLRPIHCHCGVAVMLCQVSTLG